MEHISRSKDYDTIFSRMLSLGGIFIKYVIGIEKNTTRRVYMFVSPQFIAIHAGICRALYCYVQRGTLRSVTLDEAHLLGIKFIERNDNQRNKCSINSC